MKQLNYHSFYTNLIKNKIGASFVGYVETKGKYQLKVIINKVPTYFDLVGTLKDVTPQRYLEFIEKLESHVQV